MLKSYLPQVTKKAFTASTLFHHSEAVAVTMTEAHLLLQRPG